MVNGRYRAAYEIYAHAPAARHAGLSDGQIAALVAGGLPGDLDAEQNAAAEVTGALLDGGALPRPIYDRALEQLGQSSLNAIIFTVAQFEVRVMLHPTGHSPRVAIVGMEVSPEGSGRPRVRDCGARARGTRAGVPPSC